MINRHLSARELECLAWAAQGKTYAEIAMMSGISYRTVKTYLDSCRFKLNAVNLVHAVALAIIYGFLLMPEEHVIARRKNADRYFGEMAGFTYGAEAGPSDQSCGCSPGP
jgi:DNA-binding CsgD family transcriptional regulator